VFSDVGLKRDNWIEKHQNLKKKEVIVKFNYLNMLIKIQISIVSIFLYFKENIVEKYLVQTI